MFSGQPLYSPPFFAWAHPEHAAVYSTVIHPTAIVHPNAVLHPSVSVGPFAIIDGEVALGPDCTVGPYVYLTGRTRAGQGNRFLAGCVIGEAPQDLKYSGKATRLEIGDHNVFREHVTVHRSSTEAHATIIGSHNFLMAHSHVAHNCTLGDLVIVANGALLAGHVSVGDRAFISGNCLVHQFVRVGTLALMQGGAAISKDLPPFTVASGTNRICGLNVVGLKRAGVTSDQRLLLKQAYRQIFRSGSNLRSAVESARAAQPQGLVKVFLDFLAESRRGFCASIPRSRDLGEEDL